jgi:hypothetical protein
VIRGFFNGGYFMSSAIAFSKDHGSEIIPFVRPDAFSRLDDSHDKIFYETDRFVSHLDSVALSTVEHIIESLVIEKDPVILDLMAGWDSHMPKIKRFRNCGIGSQ